MGKMFIPLVTASLDPPFYTHPGRMNDISSIEALEDIIPGPAKAALPRRTLSAITTPALTGKALGCASFRRVDGDDMVFAGDATKLYRAYSTVTATFTFSDVSRAAGYSTATGETWEFVEFKAGPSGSFVIATNFSDPVQRYVNSSRPSVSASFANLITSSSKPKARHLGIIGQFLVLGNINEAASATASYAPSRVHWSAFGAPASFTPLASTQCDYEDLTTGGAVQKITSGTEYGLVFQERQVQVMRYVGGTTIFDFSPMDYAPGTPVPNSVIAYGGSVYYISTEGFMALQGLQLKRIGNDIVDKWFWTNVEQTRFYEVSATVDPINKLIMWAFPVDTAGYAKYIYAYNFVDGRWSRWNSAIETLALIRRGTSSEKCIAFDTAHKLATFTGDVVTAAIRTNALQPVPGRRWQCNGIRMLMDHSGPPGNNPTGVTPTGTATFLSMDSPMPATTPTSSTAVNIRPDNYFPMRAAGRFISFSINISPGNSGALKTRYVGLELDYELLGDR